MRLRPGALLSSVEITRDAAYFDAQFAPAVLDAQPTAARGEASQAQLDELCHIPLEHAGLRSIPLLGGGSSQGDLGAQLRAEAARLPAWDVARHALLAEQSMSDVASACALQTLERALATVRPPIVMLLPDTATVKDAQEEVPDKWRDTVRFPPLANPVPRVPEREVRAARVEAGMEGPPGHDAFPSALTLFARLAAAVTAMDEGARYASANLLRVWSGSGSTCDPVLARGHPCDVANNPRDSAFLEVIDVPAVVVGGGAGGGDGAGAGHSMTTPSLFPTGAHCLSPLHVAWGMAAPPSRLDAHEQGRRTVEVSLQDANTQPQADVWAAFTSADKHGVSGASLKAAVSTATCSAHGVTGGVDAGSARPPALTYGATRLMHAGTAEAHSMDAYLTLHDSLLDVGSSSAAPTWVSSMQAAWGGAAVERSGGGPARARGDGRQLLLPGQVVRVPSLTDVLLPPSCLLPAAQSGGGPSALDGPDCSDPIPCAHEGGRGDGTRVGALAHAPPVHLSWPRAVEQLAPPPSSASSWSALTDPFHGNGAPAPVVVRHTRDVEAVEGGGGRPRGLHGAIIQLRLAVHDAHALSSGGAPILPSAVARASSAMLLRAPDVRAMDQGVAAVARRVGGTLQVVLAPPASTAALLSSVVDAHPTWSAVCSSWPALQAGIDARVREIERMEEEQEEGRVRMEEDEQQGTRPVTGHPAHEPTADTGSGGLGWHSPLPPTEAGIHGGAHSLWPHLAVIMAETAAENLVDAGFLAPVPHGPPLPSSPPAPASAVLRAALSSLSRWSGEGLRPIGEGVVRAHKAAGKEARMAQAAVDGAGDHASPSDLAAALGTAEQSRARAEDCLAAFIALHALSFLPGKPGHRDREALLGKMVAPGGKYTDLLARGALPPTLVPALLPRRGEGGADPLDPLAMEYMEEEGGQEEEGGAPHRPTPPSSWLDGMARLVAMMQADVIEETAPGLENEPAGLGMGGEGDGDGWEGGGHTDGRDVARGVGPGTTGHDAAPFARQAHAAAPAWGPESAPSPTDEGYPERPAQHHDGADEQQEYGEVTHAPGGGAEVLPDTVEATIAGFISGHLASCSPHEQEEEALAGGGAYNAHSVPPRAVGLVLSVMVSEAVLQDAELMAYLAAPRGGAVPDEEGGCPFPSYPPPHPHDGRGAGLRLFERALPQCVDIIVDDTVVVTVLRLADMLAVTGVPPTAAVTLKDEVWKDAVRTLAKHAPRFGRIHVIADVRGCSTDALQGVRAMMKGGRAIASAAALLEEDPRGGPPLPVSPLVLHHAATTLLHKLQTSTLNFSVPVEWHVAGSARSVSLAVRSVVDGRAVGVGLAAAADATAQLSSTLVAHNSGEQADGGAVSGAGAPDPRAACLSALRSWAARPWLDVVEGQGEVFLTTVGLNAFTSARMAGTFDCHGRLLSMGWENMVRSLGPTVPLHVVHHVHAIAVAQVPPLTEEHAAAVYDRVLRAQLAEDDSDGAAQNEHEQGPGVQHGGGGQGWGPHHPHPQHNTEGAGQRSWGGQRHGGSHTPPHPYTLPRASEGGAGVHGPSASGHGPSPVFKVASSHSLSAATGPVPTLEPASVAPRWDGRGASAHDALHPAPRLRFALPAREGGLRFSGAR